MENLVKSRLTKQKNLLGALSLVQLSPSLLLFFYMLLREGFKKKEMKVEFSTMDRTQATQPP